MGNHQSCCSLADWINLVAASCEHGIPASAGSLENVGRHRELFVLGTEISRSVKTNRVGSDGAFAVGAKKGRHCARGETVSASGNRVSERKATALFAFTSPTLKVNA